MQADETAFGKIPHRHLVSAVIVSIANDEARKSEEKVDGQIAVVERLGGTAVKISFKQVVTHYQQGGYAA